MTFRETVGRWLGRSRAPVPRPAMPQPPDEPAEAELLPGDFWHFTSDTPMNFLFNNVWFGGGRLQSMSAVRRVHGERFITLGDLYPMLGEEAEDILEEARQRSRPEKPSRHGALFLFDSRETAQAAASRWKPNDPQLVLRARILRESRTHRGDLGWLETAESPAAEAAERYWAGEPCPHASGGWEYLVDGAIFFPEWRKPPFRPFKPKSTSGS